MTVKIDSIVIFKPCQKPFATSVTNVLFGLLNFWLAGNLLKTLACIDKSS